MIDPGVAGLWEGVGETDEGQQKTSFRDWLDHKPPCPDFLFIQFSILGQKAHVVYI